MRTARSAIVSLHLGRMHRNWNREWRCVALVLAFTGTLTAPGMSYGESIARSSRPAIWFGPMQDHFDKVERTLSWNYFDFDELMKPDAPWQTAAHEVDVIDLHTMHAAEWYKKSGIPSLPAIGEMVRRLGLKTAGGGGVIYTDGLCKGAGIEGMTSDKDFAKEIYYATKIWHDAGMPLDYFIMDGPFYFGYEYSKSRCNFSIEEVARRAATTMKMIHELYPKIILVDAEGPGKDLPAKWLPEFRQFLVAFRTNYGASIDYLAMDLHWSDTWHTGYRWVEAAKEIAEDM